MAAEDALEQRHGKYVLVEGGLLLKAWLPQVWAKGIPDADDGNVTGAAELVKTIGQGVL